MLLSLKVPVAVNCCDTPIGTVGIAGVTAIDTRTAGVTLTVAEPEIVPDVADTPVLPVVKLVTMPWLFTVATLVFAALQLTELVMFCVLPFE